MYVVIMLKYLNLISKNLSSYRFNKKKQKDNEVNTKTHTLTKWHPYRIR